jgi:S-adenosylmethionine synthetase
VHKLAEYVVAKATIATISHKAAQEHGAFSVSVRVNASDDPAAGSVYLTVTGTSAEAGDDREAGRGNRINGLITPFRMMTMESAAGKNPVTHVGKLYNIATSLIAQRLVDDLPDIEEAQCLIVSEIGAPLDQPHAIEVSVRGSFRQLSPEREIAMIVADELARFGSLAEELSRGNLAIGRWPLRAAH